MGQCELAKDMGFRHSGLALSQDKGIFRRLCCVLTIGCVTGWTERAVRAPIGHSPKAYKGGNALYVHACAAFSAGSVTGWLESYEDPA